MFLQRTMFPYITTLQWSQWVVLGHSWQMLPSASLLYCPIHLALCPIEGGITWQPQESPLHPMSTGEGVAIWTAETTFIVCTPTGRHLRFLLAWTVNCSVSGPGKEGSSAVLGYMSLVGGRPFFVLPWSFIGHWSGSPVGSLYCPTPPVPSQTAPNLLFGELRNSPSSPIS